MLHGGVDMPPDSSSLRETLRRSCLAAWEAMHLRCLQADGTEAPARLAAVEAGVRVLEDDPQLNAGTGSAPNWDGECEIDAAVVDGVSGRYGAVAGIQGVANPVSVALLVARTTPHVLLVGPGATRFARSRGIPEADVLSAAQREWWTKARQQVESGQPMTFSLYTGIPCDTTGAVALDDEGLAAATSTGGAFLKLPGRVGDSPILGCGLFAGEHAAVVCSGLGEAFVETMTARYAAGLVEEGLHPQQAAERAINRLAEKRPDATGGLLVLDRQGRTGHSYNSNSFPAALLIDGEVTQLG